MPFKFQGWLSLLAIALALPVFAQDSGAEPAAAPGEAAPFVAPSVSIKPRKSMMEPKAAQALMLGLADSGKHLFAVGDWGEILVSNDGASWAQVETPVRSPLTAVTFVDDKNGWAVGHDAVVLHTGDGGKTWLLQNFQPELEKPFLDVLFLDATHGFAIGAYGLFDETTDGGASWNEVDPPAITADGLHLYKIIKLGNGDLFIAGEQGLLGMSTDAGKTWKKLDSIYEGTFFGATPVGASGVLVCGLRGNAFYTPDDRAPKWTKIDTQTTDSMFACHDIDDSHAVMVGLNGKILLTDLSTASVSVIRSPVETAYSAVLPWGKYFVLAGESGVKRVSAQ